MTQYRAAVHADVEPVRELVNRSFRGEGGWTHEAELLDGERITALEVQAMMDCGRIELALEDDALVACVHLYRQGQDCNFGMLSVEPTRQGQGIGRDLLRHCEALARSWGCARIAMTVIDVRTELIAYYQRRGYALTGESEPFPDGFGVLKVPRFKLLRMARTL